MSGTPHSTLYYEYLVMPLGLTNAPVLSFRIWLMMHSGIFLNRFIFVYLDDILMFFSIDLDGPCLCLNSISIQFNFLYIALQWLLENKLCVKAQNCEFHSSSIAFLGYILAGGKVKTDPAKIKAVIEWPVPTSQKCFLDFANLYRRFIQNYCQVAASLTCLISTKFPFVRNQEAEAEFSRLKELFTSTLVLIQINLSILITVNHSLLRWMRRMLGLT